MLPGADSESSADSVNEEHFMQSAIRTVVQGLKFDDVEQLRISKVTTDNKESHLTIELEFRPKRT